MRTNPSRWLCGIAAALLGVFGVSSSLKAQNLPWPPSVLALALDPDGAEEGSDPATFLVVRVGAANTPLTVNYLLGGTAENGVDYEPLPGSVTIPSGAYFAPIEVTPIDDFFLESAESAVIALQQPPAWPPPYIVTWPSVAVAEIADNDRDLTNHPPQVTIVRPPDGAVFEQGDDVSIVARAFDRDGRVRTVEFFANGHSLGIVTNRPLLSAGADLDAAFDSQDPSLEVETEAFADLEFDGSRIPIPVLGDLFRLVWKNPPVGSHVLTAVATDNDGATKESEPVHIKVFECPPVPVVNVRATDPVAAEPGPTDDHLNTATFTIHRKGPTNDSLRVYYRLGGTASNGVDYVELPHSVEIPAGQHTAEVVVEPLDDNLVEGLERVVLTLVPSPAADPASPLEDYRIGRAHTARAIIRDNDVPPNLPPVVRIVRPEDGDVFVAPADIRIAALARDFDGYVATVEFFEGNNSLGIVTNHPSADSILRPPFSIVWSNVPPGCYVLTAVATDNNGEAAESCPVEIKVIPRIEPPVVNIVATDSVGSEPGVLTVIDPAIFTVTRTGNTNRALTVLYSIGGTALNGVDYQLLLGRVQIPAGAKLANIVVDPLDDLLIEGTETVVLKLQPHPILSPSSSPEWWYRLGSNHVARAFIRDNDFPPTNQPPKVAMVHPQDGEMFVAPADIRLVARAHDVDGWVRTVEFFEGSNSLGIVTNPPPNIGGVDDFAPEILFQLKWENVPPGVYELTALATDNRGASSKSDPVRIKVVPSRPPVVTIYATDPYASEGHWLDPLPLDPTGPIPTHPNTATFTVFRYGSTNDDLLVTYELDGSAENGVDYHELSGEVKIPAGSRRAQVSVDPIDDDLTECTETVIARLVPPACLAIYPPPPGCYVVGEPHRATAFIFDNDKNQSPKLEIVHPSNGDVFRAHSDIEIDVLAKDPDGWVNKIEFFANHEKIGEQAIYFVVPPPPGQVQKFSMLWSNVPPGNYVLTAKATDDQGAISLSDPVEILVVPLPPLPVVTIVATDPVATEKDPATDSLSDPAEFKVSRLGDDLTDSLTVHYRVGGTASNGVDYVALSGVVTIPANAMSAPIGVDPLDDNLVEGTESVIVTLVQPPCLTSNVATAGCYLVGRPGRAIAYLRDNESPPNKAPTVAIVSPPNGAVYCAPADVRLVAAATDSDGWVTTVEFFDGDTSLGVVSNHVWIIDTDPLRLPDLGVDVVTERSLVRPFSMIWSNVPPGRHVITAVAADNEGATTRSRPVEIFVREPHELPVVNIATLDAIAREGTDNTATFRVRRIGPTNAPLAVYYSIRGTASNGVDYVLLPGSVTIPAGRHTARIVVTPISDNLNERIETVVLRLTPPSVGSDTCIIGRPARAGAIILDYDCELRAPETLPDGNLHLKLHVAAGLRFRVESSANLTDWEEEVSLTAEAEAHSYVEVETREQPNRFFRVVPEFGDMEVDD